MKIKALNGNKTVKYGFEPELGYDNPNFHGHQIGICIGVIDNASGEIIRNALPDLPGISKHDAVLEILADESIIKVEEPITQYEDNKLCKRTIYYLPYAVEGHSIYEPTFNFSNIVLASNVVNHVTLEILFVESNLNRYVVCNYDTVNISIMDIIFNTKIEDIPDVVHKTDIDGIGYYLDFYNEAGNKTELCFPNWERLRDAIVSVRLLNIITEIKY